MKGWPGLVGLCLDGLLKLKLKDEARILIQRVLQGRSLLISRTLQSSEVAVDWQEPVVLQR